MVTLCVSFIIYCGENKLRRVNFMHQSQKIARVEKRLRLEAKNPYDFERTQKRNALLI